MGGLPELLQLHFAASLVEPGVRGPFVRGGRRHVGEQVMRLLEMAILVVQDGGAEGGRLHDFRRRHLGRSRFFPLRIIADDGLVLRQGLGPLVVAFVKSRQEAARGGAEGGVLEGRELVQRPAGGHVVAELEAGRPVVEQGEAARRAVGRRRDFQQRRQHVVRFFRFVQTQQHFRLGAAGGRGPFGIVLLLRPAVGESRRGGVELAGGVGERRGPAQAQGFGALEMGFRPVGGLRRVGGEDRCGDGDQRQGEEAESSRGEVRRRVMHHEDRFARRHGTRAHGAPSHSN